MESPRESPTSTWRTYRDSVVNFKFNYDQIFYRIGLSIGNKPWVWLITSLCISGVCGPGLSFWREEIDEVKSFIPVDSIVRKDAAWVKEHFNEDLRYESIIITAPNVLDPQVLQAIDEIEMSVKSIVVQNQTWHDVCAEYLTWFENGDTKSENETDELLIEAFQPLKAVLSGDSCIYQSILKVWKKNESEVLGQLTKDKILEDVTAALRETDKGNILTDISPLLSKVEYDENGRVIGAKATILNWILKKSNIHSPEWELEFISRTLYSNRTLPAGMKIYAVAKRSFIDCLNDVMRNNISILCCGLFIIVGYVVIMIGKCNPVEQRIYLSLLGVSVVGQAILSGFGVCFYLGYMYGPIHSVLPFVLLGIGVDDMFYGKRASIYLAGVDYYEDREALGKLINVLAKNRFINNKTLDPWFIAYGEWLNNKTHEIDRDEFYGSLSEYLLTRKGQSYVKDMKFSRLPTVDYNITTSKFQIQHIHINTTVEQLQAMRSIRETIKSVDFTRGIEHAAIFSQEYVSWTANKIIGDELIRNLCLELLAVSLVTLVLLRDIKVSFWVICCVAFTLIDLLGSLYYLGLTVEISSSIIILMCAGLAVDYAAHVGLEFTRVTGTRNERSIATLGAIGPAVFNGGLSTFLAFVLLGASRAYLFSTFFKLFTSVVVFGLFHGLLFLPVVLSICGSNEKQREADVKVETVWEPNKFCTIPLSSTATNNINNNK
ncbi:GSCOCG00006280001-RA-CDS [Cotesia congregata]|nr:GSCOCG00006280001-RA-CDS [Cotesia congregata]